MTTPQDIIRPDVLAMTSYPVPDATGLIKLDAMENPYPPARRSRRATRRTSRGRRVESLSGAASGRPARQDQARDERSARVRASARQRLGRIDQHDVDGVREAGREGRSASAGLRDVPDVGGVCAARLHRRAAERGFHARRGRNGRRHRRAHARAGVSRVPEQPDRHALRRRRHRARHRGGGQEPGRDRRGVPAVRRKDLAAARRRSSTTSW